MQTIVFTLCSNNYLAHAKTLGDSLKLHAPYVQFIIGLVDKRNPDIDYSFFEPFELLEYNSIGFDVFNEMEANYNIIEFNTAVKPFFFEYLYHRYGPGTKVYYIDPDIAFLKSIEELNGLLDEHEIIFTPHLTEANEIITTDELVAMRHGHYNLGFLGTRYTTEAMRLMKWWQERLKRHCIIDKPRGLFVDQKWMNLAPLFFSGIFNFKHQGYNMAWWNLSERRLLKEEDAYFVNHSGQPLVFFHFSGFKPGTNNFFGRVDNLEYSFEQRPDLKEIFAWYEQKLLANQYRKFSALAPLVDFGYGKVVKQRTLGSKIKRGIRAVLRP